jgi:hypothetical protein
MTTHPIRLKYLLQSKHWQTYRTFCTQYDKAAKEIDRQLVGTVPSRPQLHRWLSGELKALPYPDHCRVLESMFPEWSAQEMFEKCPSEAHALARNLATVTTPRVGNIDTTAALSSSDLPINSLAGYWVTCFKFDKTMHHIDISNIIPESDRIATVTNFVPTPRSEGRASGFQNVVNVELVNRHLIGTWKNANDNYYFGSTHLAILPGETMIEGYYTGFENDVTIMTSRWRWIRLDPASLHEVNLGQVVLKDPRLAYNLLDKYTHTDSPIKLTEIVEG